MRKLIFHTEKPKQYYEMEKLVREAFWDKYSPGCCEHLVVHNMRSSPSAIKDLCIAAESDGELVGGIWYSHASIHKSNGSEIPVFTMGPVAVRPDLQGQGIGSELIRRTLNLAKEYHRSVILYGNAAYYSRFGFRPAAEFGITDAWGEECPAILVCPMGTVDSGAFDEGKVYQTTPEEVCVFDLNFPHRQKHLDSRQIFWIQPCPPPKDPLLKESWDLRNRASRFLKGSGILEAWEGIGGKIRSVGSYRNNLMMRNKDIDLHIYTETLDVSRAMEAVNALLTSPKTRRLTYINGENTDEHCLEWHLEMEDDYGELWTADMIQILAGSRLDGFFEDTAEAIIRALTPESRKRILELKASAPVDLKICGVEFYCAVLSGHVTTWEEFLQWRRNNPPESLISWRP